LPLLATKLPFHDYQIAVSENSICYQIAVSGGLPHLLPDCRFIRPVTGHKRGNSYLEILICYQIAVL